MLGHRLLADEAVLGPEAVEPALSARRRGTAGAAARPRGGYIFRQTTSSVGTMCGKQMNSGKQAAEVGVALEQLLAGRAVRRGHDRALAVPGARGRGRRRGQHAELHDAVAAGRVEPALDHELAVAEQGGRQPHLGHAVRRRRPGFGIGRLAERVAAECRLVQAVLAGRRPRLRQPGQVEPAEQRAVQRHQIVIEDAIRVFFLGSAGPRSAGPAPARPACRPRPAARDRRPRHASGPGRSPAGWSAQGR